MKKDGRNKAEPTPFSSESMRFNDNRYESLGKALKEVYEKALEEPVPDRLVKLMQQLKKAEDLKKKR
tara:strand:- start:4641 stop:4841 length:201 start_codon:yes stop_codon:yes gene_type:complete